MATNMNFGVNLLPTTDGTLALGDSTHKWKAYLNLQNAPYYTKPSGGIPASDLASGVIPAASTTTPLAPGTASAGSETAWAKGDHRHPKELPTVSASNNGDVLLVENGTWTVGEAPVPEPPAELPDVTASDNGKVLMVVSGDWAANAIATVTTSANGLMLATDKVKLDGIEMATLLEIQSYFDIETTPTVDATGVSF